MYPGVTNPSDDGVYAWLTGRAKGGDFLVLTADPEDTPCDLYNQYIYNLTHASAVRPNSVSTVCFKDRAGAFDPRTASLLRNAAGVFITGGDQAKYFEYWRDSPVSRLLPTVPLLGGSSAGLAVQGEFVYDALRGSVTSTEALQRSSATPTRRESRTLNPQPNPNPNPNP